MPTTVTQEVYEIRSISPVHINPSIMEGTQQYGSILGKKRAVSLERYAPIFLTAPTLTGDPGIPSTLFCSPGAVDAAPSAKRHYQWCVDGVADQEGEGDAFAYFLTDPSMDAKEITCKVTAINSIGSVDAMSNGIVVSMVEPVVAGSFGHMAITGMGASDHLTVFMDQIAVTTGMWVDDFVTAFECDIFAVTGTGVQDHISMPFYDIYAVTLYELLSEIIIPNNGAETGITGWNVTEGTLRSVLSTTPSGGGNYVFMGAEVILTDTRANRTVSINSSYHDEIDTGDCTMAISFNACESSSSTGDEMQITYSYLSEGDVVLETVDFFGVFKPVKKRTTNIWGYYVSGAHAVPVGTRKVKIDIFIDGINRTSGSNCQIDQISLQLYQPVA